ncbi:piggyBac transposable element-derived protein 4-like [Centroberyx affinis]|uniref:piggyBac transposable element-derived protein 4-like n=1 Tax=Centroberyx affinis TaxID=166261 RepID=UPI003A5C1CEA
MSKPDAGLRRFVEQTVEDHGGMDMEEEDQLNAELRQAQLIDAQQEEDEEEEEEEVEMDPVLQPGTTSLGPSTTGPVPAKKRKRFADSSSFPSYDEPDDRAPKPLPFAPRRPLGIDLGSVRRAVRSAADTVFREIDFFMLFFTQSIVSQICGFSNQQGWELVLNCPSYANRDGGWDEMTPAEFYRFMGLLVYMGFTHLPDVKRYWGTKPLQGSWSKMFMSRNRFKSLLAALHIVDPASEDNQDRLVKLRFLLDHLKQKSTELFQPTQNLAIDERMVKSKGRSGFMDYVKSKPARWGFKLWVIVTSDSGYTLDFNIDMGSSNSHVTDFASKIVETLVQPFRDQGHNVFFDSFYTSPALVATLRQLGLNACGTCRTNRKSFPAEFKDIKSWERVADCGDMRWCRIEPGDILALQWKDTRAVTYLSNYHKANDMTEVTRFVKRDGLREKTIVRQPKVIGDYHKQTRGLDASDDMIKTYEVQHKTQKWWKTLFYHFIDIAVVNSFLLFQEWQQCHAAPGAENRFSYYTQVDFRENLARQLGGIDANASLPSHSLKPLAPPSESFHSDHVPQLQDLSRNCWLCYRKLKVENRTKVACLAPGCNGKRLCFTRDRNCFKSWHSAECDRIRKEL